jgi:hypothetical protein
LACHVKLLANFGESLKRNRLPAPKLDEPPGEHFSSAGTEGAGAVQEPTSSLSILYKRERRSLLRKATVSQVFAAFLKIPPEIPGLAPVVAATT